MTRTWETVTYLDEPTTLYLRHRPALVAYAARILGTREAAEDVVQDAFLRFSPMDANVQAAREPLAYLYRIVRNLCLDTIKRRKVEARGRDDEPPFWSVPRPSETPEQSVVMADEVRRINAVLAGLPPPVRLALEMHRFGGYTLEEVAVHLDISVATAHRHVRSALVQVALHLSASDDA